MLLSRCCKEHIYVESTNEGTSFYVCRKCEMATDPFCSFNLGLEDLKDSSYDDSTD